MRKGIILLCVFGSIFICFNFVLFISNRNSYVIFSDKSIIKVNNKKYSFVNFSDKYLINKKFDVYDYNKYLGKYNIKFYDDTYKVYDKKEVVKFNNAFIGVYSKSKNVKLNTSFIDKLSNSDMIVLNNILRDNNINFEGELSVSEKHAINSMNGYYLYNVSYDDEISNDGDLFSIVYISNSHEYRIIDINSVSSDNYNQLVSYSIDAVIDLDDDSIDEIIISNLAFSESGDNSKRIYKFDGDKYISSK